MSPTLAAVLTEWRKVCPVGSEQLFPPTTGKGRFVKEHTLGKMLRSALSAVNAERADGKLPDMTWYPATRHSFASRWANAGGSLLKLAQILGHSTTEVTLRYAHLQPGNFTEQERALVNVNLQPAKVFAIQLDAS